MIRYNIETRKAGVVIEFDAFQKVVASHNRTHPGVIVWVSEKDQRRFEKMVEGHPDVLGYSAEPTRAGEQPKDWRK